MPSFGYYYESSKIAHVLDELLDLELSKDSTQRLRFFGVKTFEDFLDFCRDSEAIRAFLLYDRAMELGHLESASNNRWKSKRDMLEVFSRVFDLLVERQANSGPGTVDFPVDIREVDYDEYYKLSVCQYYNLPRMRPKSPKVFELPPELRSAATNISSFSTVVPTIIDAPKSPPLKSPQLPRSPM